MQEQCASCGQNGSSPAAATRSFESRLDRRGGTTVGSGGGAQLRMGGKRQYRVFYPHGLHRDR